MRILWLKTELLHPVDKGGRIRTYNMLRALKREHHITYLTLDNGRAAPDAVERATEYCHELIRIPFTEAPRRSARFWSELASNLVSPLPYAVAKYRSAGMEAAIRRCVAREEVDVLVCDFLAPSPNVPDGLAVPKVLFQHNVEALIWKRHAEVRTGVLARRYFREQWRRMERCERTECRRYDRVIAVSPEDATLLREQYGLTGVADVPTGVDTEYFTPGGRAMRKPGHLVFTGTMDWLPNEDGIRWFAEDILPRLRQLVPDVTVTVVGRNPPEAIRALAARDAAISVTGTVPDVRPYMEEAAVFVVPLRIGGGTRLKIFEAMAMECPVVSTSIGAEGLPLDDGRHLRLADDAAAFASAVADLLSHPDDARELASAASRLVREQYAWDQVAQRFAEQCELAIHPESSLTHCEGS
jgi:sugar transferase (PEP-CTERM/EpsH1 system associated)